MTSTGKWEPVCSLLGFFCTFPSAKASDGQVKSLLSPSMNENNSFFSVIFIFKLPNPMNLKVRDVQIKTDLNDLNRDHAKELQNNFNDLFLAINVTLIMGITH